MNVFKTYLKVIYNYKFIVILYSVILIGFGIFNFKSNKDEFDFTSTLPDVYIVNEDDSVYSENLVKYLESNTNVVDLSNKNVDDALFYRNVNYVIHIPKNFSQEFINGNELPIDVKSTGDYNANLAQMILEKYLKVFRSYKDVGDEYACIKLINDTLSKEVNVGIKKWVDDRNNDLAVYYNFASYSLMAGCINVIAVVMSSFREEKIRRRTLASSINKRKYNRSLLLSNFLFSFSLWLIYALVSFILIKNSMFSINGLLFLINSLVFTFFSTTLAFLIGNVVKDKNAIGGIVNSVALGSSFLCGAFVPQEYLPDFVLNIAHVLPTYWYICCNNLIADISHLDMSVIFSVGKYMLVVLLFAGLFIFLNGIYQRRKSN